MHVNELYMSYKVTHVSLVYTYTIAYIYYRDILYRCQNFYIYDHNDCNITMFVYINAVCYLIKYASKHCYCVKLTVWSLFCHFHCCCYSIKGS